MIVVALVGKELQQHGPAFAGATTLVGAILATLWFTELEQDGITLLASAQQLALVVLPLFVLYVDSRLVVHDHADGTSEFLAALPIAPSTRTLVRFAIGLAVIEATALVALLATALLATRREGVPLGWLVQLAAQIGGYVAAWHGVASGVAHLGRFRWLAWWALALVASLTEFWFDDALRSFWWFGLVSDGADRTRLAPPWDALPATLAWGTGGLLLALGLATWRGGVLVERWFRPPTADQRARLIGGGVAIFLVVSVVGEWPLREDAWATLPAVPAKTATVRAAASPGDALHEVAVASAAALDELGAAIGVEAWAPVVLLRSRAEPGRRAVTVAPDDERARVLLVDPDRPTDELVRRVVTEALHHQLGGLAAWDADASWLLDAAGPWWLGGDEEMLRRRAALGAGAAGVEDWFEVVGHLGPDVASGVAWAGLAALEREAGREAVLDVLRAVLAPRRSATWPGAVRLRFTTRGDWIGRLTGVDRARWVAAWEEALAGPAPALEAWPEVRLDVQDGAVLASWDGEVPPGTMLEVAVTDGLQRDWLPGDPTEVVSPPADAREVQLRVDVRARLAAQWVREVEGVGQVTSGWEARR